MLVILAFRNIWRNKRRTIITVMAVAFAVFLSTLMRSFQKGAWDNVIDTSVNLFYGYAQVHSNGFWDDQTIDNSMSYDEVIKNLPDKVTGVEGYAPRLESFALASSGDLTQGVLIVGIDPQLEQALTGINEKVTEGEFLKSGVSQALIAAGVGQKLKLGVGDTLILISQGYHGANAAGKYPIGGIFKYALPDLNKTLIYLPLETAQEFYAAYDRITTAALKIKNQKKVTTAVRNTQNYLDGEKFEILDYKELMPELMQARQLDEGGGYITLGILYALIAFAIFGTIIMMTQERMYEYGVLMAIGLGRWQLFTVTIIETIAVGLLGAVLGIVIATPAVYYLHRNPLDLSIMGEDAAVAFEKFGMEPLVPAAFELPIFLNQAVIIFVVTALLGIFPLFKILKMNPVTAMRS